MPKKYNHLFFDLDRTLWDFDKSAWETFEYLFQKYGLDASGIPSLNDFHKVYTQHNNMLWEKYRKGQIEKKVLSKLRFVLTLEDFGLKNDELAENLARDYVAVSPTRVNLFPNAREALDYLAPNYPLHLITNGFSEVQETKLRVSGLGVYFQTVTTSEEAGVKKPNPEIFEFALKKVSATHRESLMIGDDFEVDILGAKNVGIDQVLFDPGKKHLQNGSTFTIQNLIELKGIL